jgi:hypothetical protein
MNVSESDEWVIPHTTIVLESLLTSGRFADIYKVRYHPKKASPGDMFVAKLLKSKKATLPYQLNSSCILKTLILSEVS